MNIQGVGNNKNTQEYISAPRNTALNRSIDKHGVMSGLNKHFGFGDIIYTMAQAGKAAGECGGQFMLIA